MSSVQKALAFSLKTIRQAVTQIDFGDIIFDRSALAQLPSEYVEQIVAESLRWIGGQVYKPRNSALLRAISAKTTFSLHGCVLIPQPGNLLRISREYVAVAKVTSLCPALWDGRYFAPNHNKTYEIRALGAYGLSLCPDWRSGGIPRIALESSPSVWQNDQLISAPQAGFGQKDVLQVVPTPWE
jgi:tRNA(Ile)-lysidine synthase